MRYVVVRTGACDQGVVHVTSLLLLAKHAAEQAAEKEPDFYHSFEIRERGEDGWFSRPILILEPKHLNTGPREWREIK